MQEEEELDCVCDCGADPETGAMAPPPMEGSALVPIDGGSAVVLMGGVCREGLERGIALGLAGSDSVYTAGVWVMKPGTGVGPDEVPALVAGFKQALDADTAATKAGSLLQSSAGTTPENSASYHAATAPRTVSDTPVEPLPP